jgi:hypothetical protein
MNRFTEGPDLHFAGGEEAPLLFSRLFGGEYSGEEGQVGSGQEWDGLCFTHFQADAASAPSTNPEAANLPATISFQGAVPR